VAGNSADRAGGIEVVFEATLERTIVWGNCVLEGSGEVFVDVSALLTVRCSLLDPSRIAGSGQVDYQGPSLFVDPDFCAPAACLESPRLGGDYHLKAGSPALPALSPCGERLGPLGPGCDTPTAPTAWGRLKSRYR
jgi:hypothetical protein